MCLPATLAIQCMYRYVKYRFSNTALINSIHLLWCVEYSPATLAIQRIGEEETLKVSSISPGLLASMTDTWVWEPELWEIHTREDICSFSASFRPFSWSCQTKPKISSYLSLWFCCCPFFSLKLVSFKTTNDNFLSLFQFLVKQNKKNSSKFLISFNCHLLCQKISFCSTGTLIKLLPFLSISGWSRVIPWVPGWGGRPRPWPLSCRSLTRGDWSRTHWPPPLSPHLGSSLRSDLHPQHTRSVDKIYQ